MTYVNARSILVNLSLSKKKASNRPKTIGVLTRTKSSRSDLRIPLGYLLPDFQPHRSNFFAPPPPPPPDLTRRKGVDTKKKPVPIGLWDQLKSFAIMKLLSKTSLCQIVRNMMKNLCASFDWFSLTKLSARSIQATFFCPTNKDSIHKKPSKPIGFLMWVKKLQGEKQLGIGYLASNSEELFFWALVWPRSKWKWDFFLSVKNFQSTGVPIRLLTQKKFFSQILKNIMDRV